MAGSLLLVRHASVDSANRHRYVGRTDLPLSEEGRRQAEALVEAIRRQSPTQCLCSPLRRAVETAGPMSEALGLEPLIEPYLREINFGHWEGKTFEEICHADPERVDRWAEFSPDFAFPEGESIRGFLERVGRAAAKAIASPEDRVLVVTHGGVIRAMICHLLGLSPENYVLFEVAHASLTVMNLFEGRGVLSRLNDTCHLRGNDQAKWLFSESWYERSARNRASGGRDT